MTPKITLNENIDIPAIGFGTWKLIGDEAVHAVKTALEVGYRHIDTADRYGNHKEVGGAIKASGVPREEIFLTSKVWRDNLRREDVLADVDRFLEELQTDYIDLLLIHWPNKDIPIKETLAAMEECRQAGKIKAIGVSNFTKRHIEDALATGVPIVNNQVEMHPSFNQSDLRNFCALNNVAVTAYSALATGNMELPLIQSLAEKYDRSPAAIILNWVVSRQVVALCKSTDRGRMEDNLHATDFVIEMDDLQRIDDLEQGPRKLEFEFSEFDYE